MLYTVANDRWSPGSPLEAAETRSGLYRTRSEAGAIAPGRTLLAVAICYDATRGVVTPAPPAGRDLPARWSAPAILGPAGGVTILATIPATLVQILGPPRLHIHQGHPAPRSLHCSGRKVGVRSGGQG